MRLIDKIREPETAELLLWLFDATLVTGTVFSYRDIFDAYEVRIKINKGDHVEAVKHCAARFNCTERTIRNALKTMRREAPGARKRRTG